MSVYRRALVIPDCHIPYHHKRAYNLVLKIAKDFKPHEIVILGDFADFYAVNSHGKDPRLYHLLEKEVEEVRSALDHLDKTFPRAKKVYIEGNHEYRLERYIAKNAPSLFGVTDWRFLFDLNRRPNWVTISYGAKQLYSILGSRLKARHEPLSMSSATASVKKSLCNLVYGHVHRIEEARIVSVAGRHVVNFSPGWLGDFRRQQIYGYVKSYPNWALGFCTVIANTNTKDFHYNTHHILNNMTCEFGGKIYKG